MREIIFIYFFPSFHPIVFFLQVQSAFDLVRQGASAQGALLVAEYCQEGSDFRGAIEFLLLANKPDEAFRLAQTHSLVETYAQVLGEQIGAEEALKVALYYEKAQDHGKAGRYEKKWRGIFRSI